MQIVCPSCHTAYSVKDASMGAGRKVRCARCKSVWAATPVADDAAAPASAMAAAAPVTARPQPTRPPAPPPAEPPAALPDIEPAPHVESPPMAAGLDDDVAVAPAPPAPLALPAAHADAPRVDIQESDAPSHPLRGKKKRKAGFTIPDRLSMKAVSTFFQPRAVWYAALALLTIDATLVMFRQGIVRMVPSVAPAYAAIGMPVNLRGIAFEKVAVTTETINGTAVVTVSGLLQSLAKQPVEVPRLRFAVRDAAGHELFSWTSNLDRPSLAPMEAVAFRSIISDWPAEARDVSARFFTRADLAAGKH